MSLPHLSNELNINPAIDALDRHGLPVPIDDQTRNGLTIGLLHDSFLYEHVSEMPHATPGLLAALAAVGKSFAHRASAVYLYQNLSFDKPGPMNDRVAHIASSFHSWAGSLQWLSRSMAVGKSLNRVALPPRVPSTVCHQLIGTLCLSGLEDVANGLLRDLISTSTANYDLSAVDPTTMLLDTLGRAPLETRVEMRGPDHAPGFLVTLTDPRGRQSRGEGPSKKQATRAASADFLQKYLPRAIAEAKAKAAGRSSQISPLPVTGHEYERHAATVLREQPKGYYPKPSYTHHGSMRIERSWPEHTSRTTRFLG
jgi:dsRNA-specific ribonuclease